ncbi:D-alanyl-D-alanine carboxypeptidase [Fusibacter tunisiensis]|uniref:D-alanyl-D-alanine carboxypeptidase n=1 Tax=Fusibacter tunisiensis TaxID=1008308 RepID=A0ABS2MNA1_9FIRM|nr:M15 family metallopeptidase [Fusibacter tunisiensis]MBM7560868.1 D-alanyl-D-alanine carboxypeptidase [Fusibacter tunisiensis]
MRRYSVMGLVLVLGVLGFVAGCGQENLGEESWVVVPTTIRPSLPPVTEPSSEPTDETEATEVKSELDLWAELIRPDQFNYDPDVIGAIEDPASIYVLANKLNQLPEDYVPEDLVEPDVRFSFDEDNPKRKMRQEAADALALLFEGAKEDGHTLFALSGYRSYATQKWIYEGFVASRGQEAADTFSARPGHSEHQTGLAMDVTSASVGYDLKEAFGETPEGIWVADNAHTYGFIIRYPEDKTEITQYKYEPWHLRYVGIDLATYLYEAGLTLEEFFGTALGGSRGDS